MKKFYFLMVLFITYTTVAQNNITFSVDMSSYPNPFTTVYVSGEMNGWSGDANPMTDMGGGIWSATLSLADGEYQYKFTVDNWTVQENFTTGDACTVTDQGFVNRILQVNGADMTLDTPVFSSCYDDGNPGPHNTTFSVDMSGYGSAFTTVYISGQFNGWSGDSNPMVDMGGGIWAVTLPLPEAYTEFKFQVDNWTDQENFAEGAAGTVTNGGFTNRYINVTGEQSRSYVWATEGSTLKTDEFTADSFRTYPNPTNNFWNIATDNAVINGVQVYDIAGRQVLTLSPKTSQVAIDGTAFQRGIYIAKIETNKGSQSVKLVKN